jgi:hypothetical protein
VIAGPAPGPAVKVTLVPEHIVVALADNVGVGKARTVFAIGNETEEHVFAPVTITSTV